MDAKNCGVNKDGTTRFEDHIKLRHLKELMRKFDAHEPTNDMPPDGYYTPGRIIKRESGNVTVKEFKEMIQSMLRTNSWDTQMESLFTKVDTSADGMVDWNEFCTYMLLHYKENDVMKRKQAIPFTDQPKIRHISPNRQEPVYCVTSVDFLGAKKHVTLSKEGVLCTFDTNLHLERIQEIKAKGEEPRSTKRRFKTWYTDITYMGNVGKVVICSTGRDLRFWDISTGHFMEEFHLYALSDVPMCMNYWYDKKNPSHQSLLLVGDDMGNIHLWYFLKPYDKLFETPFTNREGVNKIWMQDLPLHQRLVCHKVIPGIHTEMVRKVQYVAETDAILSSSGSNKTSLVHLDIKGKRKTYTYKLSKGVECFDYSRDLNVVITGSLDHTVRVWNPYLEDKPVAYLMGHMMGVVGVVINVEHGHVYSYSKDGHIKVWDLRDYTCVQTLLVRFPLLSNARSPEYGPVCIYLQSNRALIACCGDYIGSIRLGAIQNRNPEMPVTHNAQLCCAMYNSFFRQVATGCDDSSVTIWDLDSGAKSFSIQESHGTEEITCIAFSTTGRKLITGARNGTIKVWNFQNGHHIVHCEPASDSEVTGLISVGKKKGILAVGWSRMITFYDDSDAELSATVKADNDWKGGQIHKDDILSVDFCRPNLLVTASFDGQIVVWSAETETVFVLLRKGQPSQICQKLKDAMSTPGSACSEFRERSRSFLTSGKPSPVGKRRIRPNSRHMSRHKPPQGFTQAPVDKVMFLQARIYKGLASLSECAVLISSEAGYLHFWSVYGRDNHKGSFYASDAIDEEESVLALATDKENSILLSGDTMGHVYVWDIEDYCVNSIKQVPAGHSSRPPLLHTWRAHDMAVVSVEFIPQNFGLFVLTASTDWTARLWTLDGEYVGTFGQEQQWNLRNPDTYQHPKTPWSYLEDKNAATMKPIYSLDAEEDQPPDMDDALDIISPKESEKDEAEHNLENQGQESNKGSSEQQQEYVWDNPTNKVSSDDKLSDKSNDDENGKSSKCDEPINKTPQETVPVTDNPRILPALSSPSHNYRTKVAQENTSEYQNVKETGSRYDGKDWGTPREPVFEVKLVSATDQDESFKLSEGSISQTGVKKKQSSVKHGLLGVQIEQGLARITQSRQQRRQRYGDVNVKATARFGKTCSPFQALSLLQTDTISFPSNLPMTASMAQRGFTCTTERDLRNLTLSPLPFNPELKVDKLDSKSVDFTAPLPAIGSTVSRQSNAR